MSRQYGFAIIGCGSIADFHARAISQVKGAKLVAVCDANYDVATALATKWQAKAYKSYEHLLQNADVDVVNICTPSGLHAKQALKALDAGKNIMVEKPLGLNIQECDAIIESVKQNKKLCAVISQLRYSKSTRLVKKALQDGAIGKPVEVGVYMKYNRSTEYYSSSKWRGTWEMDGGGALMNQGIHGVDIMLYLMGNVKSVQAITKTLVHNIEVEDTAIAIVEFETGAVGVIEGTTSILPGYPRRFEICGAEGSIVLEEDRIIRWDAKYAPNITQKDSSKASGHSNPVAIPIDGHVEQIKDMVNALKEGRNVENDAQEGKKPVELICAIYEAAKSESKVLLNL